MGLAVALVVVADGVDDVAPTHFLSYSRPYKEINKSNYTLTNVKFKK